MPKHYRYKKMINALIRIPQGIPRANRRYFSLTNAVGLGGFIGHLVLFTSFLYFDIMPLAWFNVGSLALFAGIFTINRFGYATLGLYLGIAEIVFHAIIAVILIGWNSGFYFYLLLVFMVVFLARKKYDKTGLIISVLNLIILVGLMVYAGWLEKPLLKVSVDTQHFYSINNLVVTSILLAVGVFYYKHTANHVEEELETMYKHTTDSIRYAHRIQDVLLPDKDYIRSHVKEHFIFYQPRDIVSGDFYWMHFFPKEQQLVIAAIDCTGHGVPGAFMTMMAGVLMESIVVERGIRLPNLILEEMHKSIFRMLKQESKNRQEGMDMSVCCIDFEEKEISYSGARSPMLYVENGQLNEIKATRRSVGGKWRGKSDPPPFELHCLPINDRKPTSIYLFSDGYIDQFGGTDDERFSSRKFREMIQEVHPLSMDEQQMRITNIFNRWKGRGRQIDDVMVIGIKV